jgi:hypothetical protein
MAAKKGQQVISHGTDEESPDVLFGPKLSRDSLVMVAATSGVQTVVKLSLYQTYLYNQLTWARANGTVGHRQRIPIQGMAIWLT